jgi:hypothetical protein
MSGQIPWRQSAGGGQLAPPQSTVPSLDQVDDPRVLRVSSAPSSPEALLFGVSLGALSAMLLVWAIGYGPGDVLRGLSPAALFIGAWIAASWILTRDTGRILVVLRRGFFLGALQWAVLALEWAGGSAGSAATPTSAASGSWPTSMLRDASSVFVWVCVAGFVICWLCTRSAYQELEADQP